MLKQKYFLTDFFILSAEKQPIKLSWRNIEWLLTFHQSAFCGSMDFLFSRLIILSSFLIALPCSKLCDSMDNRQTDGFDN